jgi:ribosomal protein L11 methyltransferase
MSDSNSSGSVRSTVTFSRPYRDLFIYLIAGKVEETEICSEEAFLGNWLEDAHSFLFFGRPSDEAIQGILRRRPDLTLVDEYHLSYEQWQGGDVSPVKVGGLVIAPPWEEIRGETGKRKIVLDPGVVFGNGLHPTTRDCLRALNHLRRGSRFAAVLDLGTGSGVLALAAAAWGASRVLAVDLNPLCVKTARKNVDLNGLADRVVVKEGRAEDFSDEPADLVVANIHYEVTKHLLCSGGFRNKRWWIISGMMRSQAREIKGELERIGAELIREWDHEMTWFTFLAKSRSIKTRL